MWDETHFLPESVQGPGSADDLLNPEGANPSFVR